MENREFITRGFNFICILKTEKQLSANRHFIRHQIFIYDYERKSYHDA
jgi:hypothetical protein